MYLYHSIIIPEKIENLAFMIGHLGAISNISTYGLQAEWLLAHNLTGGLVSGGTTGTSDETAAMPFIKEEIIDLKEVGSVFDARVGEPWHVGFPPTTTLP